MTAADVSLTIHTIGDDPAVRFAGEELARYLGRITSRGVGLGSCETPGVADGLYIGPMASFPNIVLPEVAQPSLDDAIAIDVVGARGTLAGINGRSVLLAVYRYLTELGCRWVRPGPDGEFLPAIDCLPAVKVEEAASYRHRGVCIEGAVGYEHVRDMVDWLPKLGFNSYFMQFREAHTFLDRWYSRAGNPYIEGEPLSLDAARQYTADIETEISKRGLLYHKVGHGWTCEPFGVPALGWEKQVHEPDAAVAKFLAQVNGERTFWDGIAINTNLCYSNPEARRIVNGAIASYIRAHPDIRFLHFWLADGANNNCECDECRKARPSDYYVTALNELEDLLSGDGMDTSVVFPLYVDLLWPPTIEKPRVSDRFVLMFAPITRTYSESFRAFDDAPDLPPYQRNKLEFPRAVDENVAFLKAWQEKFQGDSFDFDYHLMWDHLNDPGHMQISEIIGRDMKGLQEIGLNGCMSCQVQRVFVPTSLPMIVMGRMLWNRSLEFADIVSDYFAAAFGPEGAAVCGYLGELSDLFDPQFLRGEKGDASEEAIHRLTAIPGVVEAFAPTIERNIESAQPCHAKSWFYLKHHAELTKEFAKALKTKARGEDEGAAEIWQKLKKMAWGKEPELHRVLDTWLFTGTLGKRFE